MADDEKQKTPLGAWLDRQYIKWQDRLGQKKTWGEYAEFLGTNTTTLHRYSYKKDKDYDPLTIIRIAAMTGDFSIYDIIGEPKPSMDVQRLMAIFPTLTEDQRQKIIQQAEDVATANRKSKEVGAV